MRVKYSCDFETTEDLNGARVWSWALASIDEQKIVKRGTDIESFFNHIKYKNFDIYFHNLKFDGNYLLHYIMSQLKLKYNEEQAENTFSTLITEQGQHYHYSIIWKKYNKRYVKTDFYDSFKLLPFKIKDIAKAFNLPIKKGEIDYLKYRPKGYEPTIEEWEYQDNDSLIGAGGLKALFEQDMDKMTIGSNALAQYRKTMKFTTKVGKIKDNFRYYFPVLPLPIDDSIRMSYKGGYTYLNPKYKGLHLKGIVFDVNSLYPYVMNEKKLPYGTPIFYKGKYIIDENYDLYIQRLSCSFELKDGHLPTIQVKNNTRFVETQYLTSSNGDIIDLTLTSVDLEMFLEAYDVLNIEYEFGYKFLSSNLLFKDYIAYWSDIKAKSKGALRTIAKLMLNSLYGKFASSTRGSKKIPTLKNNKIVYENGEVEEREPIYTALACFVTAYAREITIKSAMKNYDRFIYADTDSLHLLGHEIPTNIKIHKTDLGAWKHESVFDDSKFLRAKTYMEYERGDINSEGEFEATTKDDYTTRQWHIVCAGMPNNIHHQVTWDNFIEGMEYEGKLRPNIIEGGVVLDNTTFKIKGVKIIHTL